MTYIEKHEWEEKYNEATGRADFFEPNSLVIPINSAILLTRMLLATSIHQALAEERDLIKREVFDIIDSNENKEMQNLRIKKIFIR